MENLNIDENTMNKLKGMLNNGDLNNLVSQIPPEMMQNFSNLISNNSEVNNNKQSINSNSSSNNQNVSNNSFTSKDNINANNNINGKNNYNNINSSNNFDFSKIDVNMMLKMKSIMENLNSSNDPRSNLLYSLKPYLRDEKKNKIDQYANLLNFAKVAEVFKSDNKENKKNE